MDAGSVGGTPVQLADGRTMCQSRSSALSIGRVDLLGRSDILVSMNGKPGPKSPMTDEHKAALARGRAEGRIVKEYLEALRASKPKRGRKRTPDSIKKRLAAI